MCELINLKIILDENDVDKFYNLFRKMMKESFPLDESLSWTSTTRKLKDNGWERDRHGIKRVK